MKVSLLLENASNYLALLGKALPSHSQVPILSSLLLTVGKNGFSVRATDFELGVEVKIPAKIEKEGSVAVPGRELLEVLGSFPKDKVEIELDHDILTVECRGDKARFNTIPSDEFPALYKTKGEKLTELKKEEFSNYFSNLSFSTSQDETRPQLTGILMDPKKDYLNLVSTDGYRMTVKKINASLKGLLEPLIVSVKQMVEAIALKDNAAINIFVNKSENQVIFECGNVTLVGRTIEGKFPDYEVVIPKKSQTEITFDKDELLQNVKLASVFAKDTSNIVKIEAKGNTLKLLSKTQGVGEGEFEVDCKKEGEDVAISLNARYLTDLLKNVSEKEIILKLNSSQDPALFEIKEKDFIHVIMPVAAEG